MIRESIAKRTSTLARPLLQPGRRGVRRSVTGKPRPLRRPERYPALDNARFVLIVLVVVGHMLEQLVDTGPLAATLYRWIYLFHMPAFVLISGAVARSSLDRRRIVALGTGLLLPYLVFQTLYTAVDAWLFQTGDWSQGYIVPYWLLWYLPSLACWRLLLPVYTRLKGWGLPLAIAVALAAGIAPWIGYPFSLSRTLVFFPLFLLGHRIGAPALQRLGSVPARKLAAAGILLAAAVGAWWLRDADPRWLYASFDYASLGDNAIAGIATRTGLLCVSAICALAVLALVPQRPRWDGAGQRSLNTYLLHGFLVRAAVAAGVFTWLGGALPESVALAVAIVTGFTISAVLSTRAIDRAARPLMRPVDWILENWRGVPGHTLRDRKHPFKRTD